MFSSWVAICSTESSKRPSPVLSEPALLATDVDSCRVFRAQTELKVQLSCLVPVEPRGDRWSPREALWPASSWASPTAVLFMASVQDWTCQILDPSTRTAREYPAGINISASSSGEAGGLLVQHRTRVDSAAWNQGEVQWVPCGIDISLASDSPAAPSRHPRTAGCDWRSILGQLQVDAMGPRPATFN